MLIRNSITFTPRVEDSVQPYILAPETIQPNHRTIGIHSRHIRETNDGSDVSWEMECLDLILQSTQPKNNLEMQEPCTVLVMADRSATLAAIKLESNKRNCSVVVVEHENSADGAPNYEQEHGPFAGAGFFRDWLVVSQAQTGFVHYKDRSSSALVYETMVYDGVTQGQIDSPVLRCSIDWRMQGKLDLHQH